MTLVNQNIKVLRKRMGVTQEKFAELLGIKRSLIGAYEENRAIPPAENLNKISKVFGVTLDQLLNYSYEKEFNRQKDLDFEQSKPKEDFYPIERKPIFAKTQQENNNLFEHYSKSQSAQQNDIKYIHSNLFEKYISETGFRSFLENLPRISLPFLTQSNLLAFDAPKDFPLENCVLVAEKILNFDEIVEGENHLLVTVSHGFVYRRIYNQLRLKGVLLTNSDKSGIRSQEFTVSDIKEIWRPISFVSKSMPLPEVSLESISKKVEDLKTEIDFITGFRAKK